MATQLVHSVDWEKLCQQCSDLLRGTLVTLQEIHRDNTVSDIARDVPLRSIAMDRTDACSDILRIEVEHPRRTEFVHLVKEPIHIRVVDEGQKLIEIEAEEGSVRLICHAGKFPMLLRALRSEG
jgi:hypothetical protein